MPSFWGRIALLRGHSRASGAVVLSLGPGRWGHGSAVAAVTAAAEHKFHVTSTAYVRKPGGLAIGTGQCVWLDLGIAIVSRCRCKARCAARGRQNVPRGVHARPVHKFPVPGGGLESALPLKAVGASLLARDEAATNSYRTRVLHRSPGFVRNQRKIQRIEVLGSSVAFEAGWLASGDPTHQLTGREYG